LRQIKERDRSSSNSGRIRSREIKVKPKVLVFNRTPEKKRKQSRPRLFSADDI